MPSSSTPSSKNAPTNFTSAGLTVEMDRLPPARTQEVHVPGIGDGSLKKLSVAPLLDVVILLLSGLVVMTSASCVLKSISSCLSKADTWNEWQRLFSLSRADHFPLVGADTAESSFCSTSFCTNCASAEKSMLLSITIPFVCSAILR